MLPTQYKAFPEDTWHGWTSGSVDDAIFISGWGKAYPPYKINKITVYSFKFDTGRIWTVDAGWVS